MDSLKSAIGKVNDTQLEAGQAVDALMTGETQDLHRTMVALQQADVSFQLMMQIRNKLVAAYEEIQRMQSVIQSVADEGKWLACFPSSPSISE